MYILYDGRLVQCCADWEQTGVKGTICDGCTKDAAGDESRTGIEALRDLKRVDK